MASGGKQQQAWQEKRVVIIGAGPGGLCMAIKLLEAGHNNFQILEKAGGVGGTWWHNRYPGAACDVPSHLYSYSFEIKLDWSRPYADQPELHRYFDHCARKYGVVPHIRFNTEVTRAEWDEERLEWRIGTASGEEIVTDIVVAAQGMFNEPYWPAIDGLGDFSGTLFHSARWDVSHDLRGERVGVIGSAASAVQFVPEIAPQAGQLKMFQRTANWVLPKANEPYDEETLAQFAENPAAADAIRSKVWRDLEGFILFDNQRRMDKSEELGLRNLQAVQDPELRRIMTPDHPFGCKRPLMSDLYYPVFNRDNVKVITDGIDRVTRDAILARDGTRHEVDTIIMATGYDVSKYLSAIDVIGRNGRRLADVWNDGAQAYLGITTAGFPNLFQIYGPNTNNGCIIFMIECQVAYIMRQLEWMGAETIAWMDVRPEVMSAYNEAIQRDAAEIKVWWSGCTNYYRAPSGRVVTQYPHNMAQYQSHTAMPDPDAYEVHRA